MITDTRLRIQANRSFTLVGMDTRVNTGTKVPYIPEPILLLGIPESALLNLLSQYVGKFVETQLRSAMAALMESAATGYRHCQNRGRSPRQVHGRVCQTGILETGAAHTGAISDGVKQPLHTEQQT